MRLVIATHHLGLGGTATYTLTVAEQLERLGHDVTIHAAELSPLALTAAELGMAIMGPQDELPSAVDALIVQDNVIAYALAHRYPGAPQVFVSHSAEGPLQVPPQLPGVSWASVAMNDRVARRLAALGLRRPVVRLRQPIDLDRFRPPGVDREPARRLLIFGNYLHGARLQTVLSAARAVALEPRVIGVAGSFTPRPESELGEADIVVGNGRCVLEAMACGRAAYVYGQVGGDGWISPENYSRMEADGFAGTSDPVVMDECRLVSDLRGYRAERGRLNRDLVCLHHDARNHATELVELIRSLGGRSRGPRGPLLEMGRMVHMHWRAERQVDTVTYQNQTLRREGEQLRAENQRTRQELAAYRRQQQDVEQERARERAEGIAARERAAELDRVFWDLRATRRFRLMAALVGPVDRARALWRRLR